MSGWCGWGVKRSVGEAQIVIVVRPPTRVNGGTLVYDDEWVVIKFHVFRIVRYNSRKRKTEVERERRR